MHTKPHDNLSSTHLVLQFDNLPSRFRSVAKAPLHTKPHDNLSSTHLVLQLNGRSLPLRGQGLKFIKLSTSGSVTLSQLGVASLCCLFACHCLPQLGLRVQLRVLRGLFSEWAIVCLRA